MTCKMNNQMDVLANRLVILTDLRCIERKVEEDLNKPLPSTPRRRPPGLRSPSLPAPFVPFIRRSRIFMCDMGAS